MAHLYKNLLMEWDKEDTVAILRPTGTTLNVI